MEKTPNHIIWHELQSDQPEKMKLFAQNVFGYEWEEEVIDEGYPYHIATQGDKPVSGLVKLPQFIKEAGGQSFHIYTLAVHDLKAKKEEILSLGGRILVDEIKVNGIGCWLMAIDPQGAAFCLMEETQITVQNRDQNIYSRYEVISRDPKESALFYAKLCHWIVEEVCLDDGRHYYRIKTLEGRLLPIFFRPMDERLKKENITDFWIGFIRVKDMGDICQKIEKNNGVILPMSGYVFEGEGYGLWIVQPDGSIIGISV